MAKAKLAKIRGLKSTCIIQPLEDNKGKLQFGDKEINDILIQKHLTPAMNQEIDKEWQTEVNDKVEKILQDEKANLNNPTEDYNQDIEHLEVSEGEQQMNINATPGPDKVLPIFIEKAGNVFQLAMTIAFNACFMTGLFPQCHKRETRIYFGKEGKPNYNISKAYRSIALNSCIGKIQERILKRRLQIFMDSNGLLGP